MKTQKQHIQRTLQILITALLMIGTLACLAKNGHVANVSLDINIAQLARQTDSISVQLMYIEDGATIVQHQEVRHTFNKKLNTYISGLYKDKKYTVIIETFDETNTLLQSKKIYVDTFGAPCQINIVAQLKKGDALLYFDPAADHHRDRSVFTYFDENFEEASIFYMMNVYPSVSTIDSQKIAQ